MRHRACSIAPQELDSSYDFFMDSNLLNRITFGPAQCAGRPRIRGMRTRVMDILELMAAGADRKEILVGYPYLEPDDTALLYATRRSDHWCYKRRSGPREVFDCCAPAPSPENP